MPIKQLQLRGISRTPSDRASADGGCAESLNVHLDQGETAPTMPPDMTVKAGEIYGDAVYKCKIVFIHKMLGVTNYIGMFEESSTQQFRVYGDSLGGGHGSAILTIGSGEEMTYVSSVGNTLIIFTNLAPHYFLFKENAYVSLGTEIPRPKVEVITKSEVFDAKQSNRYSPLSDLAFVAEGPLRETVDADTWNSAAENGDANHDELMQTMDNVWQTVTLLTGTWRNKGVFAAPFFLRYALKLYDGSYIYSSTPIFCGGGGSTEGWLRVFVQGWRSDDSFDNYRGHLIRCSLRYPFYVYLRGGVVQSEWSDIVKSVDFFASTPIYTPAWEAGFDNAYSVSVVGAENNDLEIVLKGMASEVKNQTILEEVLSKGQFYKIMSIGLNDNDVVRKLRNGTLKIEASDDISGEKLATHDDMPDGYRDGNQYLPKAGVMNYNSRLMLEGGDERITRGDEFLNGLSAMVTGVNIFTTRTYALRYKIVDPLTGKAYYVMANYGAAGTYDPKDILYPGCITNTASGVVANFGNNVSSGSGTNPYHPSDPWTWIAYPDTRCKEVEVIVYEANGTSWGKKVPMEPHPYLECAYAFIGLGKSFLSLQSDSSYAAASSTVPSVLEASEDRLIPAWNKVFLSSFQNPFLFPAEGIITFPDDVVGAAVTSVPLSEGQFGEFPMYVFTEGGIRVLVTNSEGTFSANMAHPGLSRHIALHGSILGMEQAIVFITERGVMLLSGSTVTEISGTMNGMPYSLAEGGVSTFLGSSDWSNLLGAATAGETLMQFMGSAQPAYDHNGRRLIFFNPEKAYQYVYMLDTQSWHKIVSGITGGTILNSYPECLVSFEADVTGSEKGRVYNFSTVLNNALLLSRTEDPVIGIIATRPFDLGEPDIRKAIRSIRIRGNYNRSDVQYILLGSFDGINWKRLTSLRGGSYKQFRLVMLTNLTATERITWVDVDYESRFTNRLR